MLRHLIIASAFLGTGLLLGSGVVILQLWTRSSLVESQVAELQRDLEAARGETQAGEQRFREVNHRATTLESTVTDAELERDTQLKAANELRRQLAQAEAQKEELAETADLAVKRVVALQDQLAQISPRAQLPDAAGPTAGNSSAPGGDRAPADDLVQVQKRPDSPRLAKPEFDDTGWQSVTAETSRIPQQVAPAGYFPTVPYSVGPYSAFPFSPAPYSVGYPVDSVIALPPY